MQTVSPTREPGKIEIARSGNMEQALTYAARGWPVIPLHTPTKAGCSCQKEKCLSPGKHPRIANGVKGATTDPSKISDWWRRWPEANIGIATGKKSGICVLDVDGTSGQDSLKTLSFALPQTLRAETGRRDETGARSGSHRYFRLVDGESLRNSIGLVGKNLDVRGEGGYVVAPPSLHPSGLRYEWANDRGFIAELPESLRSAASQPSPTSKSVGRSMLFFDGARTAFLLKIAGKMRRKGEHESQILEHLRTQNAFQCRPPLADGKVRGIAKSAAKWPCGGPDPLSIAVQKVKEEDHPVVYNKLLSLIRHLHQAQPGRPIMLPVERVAEAFGCDPALISRHRLRAVRQGYLQELQKYNRRAGKATTFLVLDIPP